jgi:hypothetical protein
MSSTGSVILSVLLIFAIIFVITCLVKCKGEEKKEEKYSDIIAQYFENPIEFPKQYPETVYTRKQPNDSCGNCYKGIAKKCVTQGLKKELSNREIFSRYVNGTYTDEKYSALKSCLENAPLSNFCVSFCAEAGENRDECIKSMCWQDVDALSSCFFNSCVDKCELDDIDCIKACQETSVRGTDY